jgi:hypothetical protein
MKELELAGLITTRKEARTASWRSGARCWRHIRRKLLREFDDHVVPG